MGMGTILLDEKQHVATITINNPDKLNALTHQMMRQLKEVLCHVKKDEKIRVVIITGKGERAFAAGADIKKMVNMKPLQIIQELPEIQDVVKDFERLPKPIIARINGIALGGGH